MESFEILAEVAVGLAGFGSIAVVLAQDEGWSGSDFFRVTALLMAAFGALFLALFPIGLGTSALEEGTVWRASSSVMTVYGVVTAVVTRNLRNRHLHPALRLGPALVTAVIGSAALNLVFQLLNVSGLVFEPNATCYFFGVIWFLGFACLLFVRIFFYRPTEES